MQNFAKTPAVRIVPNKNTGFTISAYATNPGFGYIQLEQTANEIQGGWLREVKRSCLLRAQTALLEKFVAENKTLQIPGKIVVQEYSEDAIPEGIKTKFLTSKKQSYEELVANAVKRAGNDGPVLMTGDKRILRFSFYDNTGLVPDVFVAHDNAGDGSSAQAAADAQQAVLPVGAGA
jgi:hypothetical protein